MVVYTLGVLGIKLRVSGLDGKYVFPLNHLPGPSCICLEVLEVMDNLEEALPRFRASQVNSFFKKRRIWREGDVCRYVSECVRAGTHVSWPARGA